MSDSIPLNTVREGLCLMSEASIQARYEALLGGQLENVESFLQRDLMRQLNAEISLSNVKTAEDCVDWLKCTFFYVRAEERSRSACRNAEFETSIEGESFMSIQKIRTIRRMGHLFTPRTLAEQTRTALKVLQAYGIILMEEHSLRRTGKSRARQYIFYSYMAGTAGRT